MSRLHRRSDPLNRRARIAVAAGAVVALLGVAAVIGQDGRSSNRGNDSASTSVDGGGASFDATPQASSAPTTFPTSTDGDAAVAYDESASSAPQIAPSDGGAGTEGGISRALAPLDAKIIRTGNLEVEVKKGSFDAATTRLSTIATSAGGFVSASETSALDDRPRGSVTLRVPADKFDQVVGEVSKVGDVTAVNTSSQDVSGEYTDLVARLKALQGEREQITLVLGRAESIPDILSVRDRLSVVQGEIEQLQGRQTLLDDQTALSTLTVSLTEAGDPAATVTVPSERTGFSKLWHDSVDRFADGGRSIALGLATMAPWLLLGLVLFVPVRMLWRRAAPVPTPPSAGPPATVAD